jgi:glyoxylase-like metal-dependent hydrolase (beta-lactamase superfamily II)
MMTVAFWRKTLKAITYVKDSAQEYSIIMHVTKLEDYLFLIDVQTAGMRNFIASYVLKGRKVAIVETGPTSSVPNLLSALKALGVSLDDVVYVAVSHIHLDHGGGVGTLLKHLPNARVIVHQRGVPHLANPEKLWQRSKEVLGSITELYGAPEPVPESRIIASTDGMTFDVGNNVGLEVVETLGHASHHLSYNETLSQGVFPGDAAGVYLNEINVVVPTTPTPFRLDIALASLDKLISLKPKALYYSHFGKATNAEERLRAYGEQLKLWARIAKQGLTNREDLAAISNRIRQEDPVLQRAAGYVRVHPVLGETVLNESVQGVVDYVEKFGDTGF